MRRGFSRYAATFSLLSPLVTLALAQVTVQGRAWAGRWHREILALASLLWAIASVAPLAAQQTTEMQPPPRHDSRSSTGVSYHNGSFSFEEEDLSIGGGMPAGLSLLRSYNSSSDGYSYPFLAPGWTSSLNIYIAANTLPQFPIPPEIENPPNYPDICIFNVVGGPRSTGFYYAPSNPPTIYSCTTGKPGAYIPAGASGDILEFIGAVGTGHFRYTGADGSVINFLPGAAAQAEYWIMPDGTRLDFTYSLGTHGTLRSVFSNRGWAILMESASKACAVNLALTYVTPSSPCPADAQTVTYGYAAGTYRPLANLLTSMTRSGATRSYGYASNDHVNCITDPGQPTCRIQNTYFACPHEPTQPLPQPMVRRHDPVVSQVDGSGKTYQYLFLENRCPYPSSHPGPDYRPFSGTVTQASETGVSGMVTSTATTRPGGQLDSLSDPLNRTTTFSYDDPNVGFSCCMSEEGELTRAVYPEGNSIEYVRDARGNVTSQILHAKPSSGLADLVMTAAYPATCANIFTCNQPSSFTDARGNTTDYTYDPAHGAVLTETGPVVSGVRPQTRHSYAQRYAWIMAVGGGYVQGATPVWVRTSTSICRTSAATGNPVSPCAVTGDEVLTQYDYGPNSGPNNLLLRGQTVTADSVTLRTCYGYDAQGNRISETQPNAGLTSCS